MGVNGEAGKIGQDKICEGTESYPRECELSSVGSRDCQRMLS